MIVRRFLSWSGSATAEERAEGASALARAYLYGDLDDVDQAEAETALVWLTEDPSPVVRRALAEALASAVDAPHPCILALAGDQSDISSVVLSRSPVLTDVELVDFAGLGDAFAQAAIAVRPGLGAGVCAALAEVGSREAAIALAVNDSADLREAAMLRIVERHGDDGEAREALLSRPNLPASVRIELTQATARALAAFVIAADWIGEARAERATREACEKGTVLIASDAASLAAAAVLAGRLRRTGRLTAGLLLRSLACGETALFVAALAELSGQELRRVEGLVASWRGAGFGALYIRAGLPKPLLAVFRAALGAIAAEGADVGREPRLSRPIIRAVLAACEGETGLENAIALLRRLDAEAAREAGRDFSAALLAAPPMLSTPESTSGTFETPVASESDSDGAEHSNSLILTAA